MHAGNVSEKSGCRDSKKCRSLRIATMQALPTTAFKQFCRGELGSAPNDFQIQESEKTGDPISEATVSNGYNKIRC